MSLIILFTLVLINLCRPFYVTSNFPWAVVEGKIMTWNVHVGYCVLYFIHLDSYSRVWDMSLSVSKRGFGFSPLSIRIIRVVGVSTVVRSGGYFPNWVRAGISLPLVIISNIISSASIIPLLIVGH